MTECDFSIVGIAMSWKFVLNVNIKAVTTTRELADSYLLPKVKWSAYKIHLTFMLVFEMC